MLLLFLNEVRVILAFLNQVTFIWTINSRSLAEVVCMIIGISIKSYDIHICILYAIQSCMYTYMVTLLVYNLCYSYNYNLSLFSKYYLILIVTCIYCTALLKKRQCEF